MKRSVEVSGKTLEEVLERASRYFDVSRERLGYEVLSETKGFLSVFVPRMVKVRVWVKDEEETEAIPKASPPETSGLSEAHEVVEKFLRELVAKMDLEVTVDAKDDNGVLRCMLDGKDAGILIGRKGETLEALEVLVRTFLARRGFGEVPLEVDVSGYRKRREEALRKLAERMARKVVREKKRIRLAPMNARERRIVHMALKDHPEVVTYSVGEEPNRRVVIDLKAQQKKQSRPKNRARSQRHEGRNGRAS
ncbi:RNA-binding cell elongation regulator Jag/EloR [Candidatus Caldatribacterium sp.]|uniref:RNA-binding cell elongation regulator Jag/EloR n=1 Tax=Candidatus Caldatribacterium sp. TaxID=2282143 RepID=UPI002999EF3F|nr:protein jag [Candidatus Caldatribacterium sp.]MDW8081914.1 RNA-binding cell elongation regulator Jag/EloR [Candidatus Calescibacterium sp.]